MVVLFKAQDVIEFSTVLLLALWNFHSTATEGDRDTAARHIITYL